VLFENTCIVLADVQKGSFLAALDATNGNERWRTPRGDVPTWGTPTVHRAGDRTQVLVNGFKEIAGYDLADGQRIWTMSGGGDIPVPTPVVAHGMIFMTSAHGPQSPVFAIKTTAEGDVSLPDGQDAGPHIAWSIRRGGNYMQTPIAVGDLLFCCRDNGLLTCFEAATGKELYRERLGGNGFTASPVAAGDRVYFTSEEGHVYVIKAARQFELLAENELGEPCLATPAITDGTVLFRTQGHLIAVGEP
jgi:outer membrane protein assembly factor BamB